MTTQTNTAIELPTQSVGFAANKLRGVNVESPEYQELRDAIEQAGGVTNLVSIRRASEEEIEEGSPEYLVVDGGHRQTALLELTAKDEEKWGVQTYNLRNISPIDAVLEQLVANDQVIRTAPMCGVRAIKFYMSKNPGISYRKIAERMGRTPAYVTKLMSLDKYLPEDVQEKVISGEIPPTKATELAKAFKADSDAAEALVAKAADEEVTADDFKKEVRNLKKAAEAGSMDVYIPPAASLISQKAIREEMDKDSSVFSKKAKAFLLGQDKETLKKHRQVWEAKREAYHTAKVCKDVRAHLRRNEETKGFNSEKGDDIEYLLSCMLPGDEMKPKFEEKLSKALANFTVAEPESED